MMAPIGCAKRAVGTMLAMTNPIDRMLQVLMSSAMVNESHGIWGSRREIALPCEKHQS